jgi:hypothetical protein
LTTDSADEIREYASQDYEAAKVKVRHASQAALAFGLIYLLLDCLVFAFLSSNSFTRFGAFAIAIGVISIGIMRRAYSELASAHWYVDHFRTVELVANTTGYGNGTDRNLEYHRVGDLAYQELKEQSLSIKRFEVADILLIVGGTLQSAYGDWLYQFMRCGAISC